MIGTFSATFLPRLDRSEPRAIEPNPSTTDFSKVSHRRLAIIFDKLSVIYDTNFVKL
ncbi:hypothetical protein CKA32_002074 [Geitlerinema sp. FC II]|nr:hypothetical protein [Geitlerinema sp. CS-897]PPT09626.1 hypothetical protein CKA32_002074 [Geitlerinema sp. FC II]